MVSKPLISVKNIFIIAFIIVISFMILTILLSNDSTLRMFFGDLFPIVIDLLVVLTLFYAAIRSVYYGRRVQMAWMFIALAFSFYTIGDILWAILELGFNQNPFPSVADGFYLIFYPLFAIGIYYLSKFSFSKSEMLKIFLDMGIIFIAVGLIFWTFLIMPTFSSQQNSFANIISVSYIIGDFLLFFVLLRWIYSKFDDYFVPILFLSMGILFMIITDSFYAYQTLQGTYISGGLLDTGWIISFIMVGLAAFLQASNEKIDLKRYSKIIIWIQKSNLISYLPFIWVLIAFILLLWVNDNQSESNYQLIKLVVGLIIFLVVIRQFITLKENKNLLVVAEKEVESRKIAENEAHESEIYYRAIFENTGTAIIMIDQDMTISRVNSEVERLTGFSKEEIEGKKKWTDFVVEEELDRIKGYYDLRNDPNKRPREYETKGQDKEGNIKDILVTVVTIPDTQKLLASLIDITKSKNAENLIKSSLNEKNILLREIHHRVKNNMQIISSLLNLQTRYTNDEKAVNILKESQNRVRSMAMIHEKLYQSKDLSHINFIDYIQSLVSKLFYSYNIEEARIKPVLEIENVNLNMETAVPCGLIISELISNSLKYAFPNEMKGNIHITLKSVDDKYELIISDNGIGLPADFDLNKLESLGLLLVNTLIEQIDGKITINKSHPTQFKITFKELKYKERI
ncbi:histidine kinase dimerization/phosphoacceptor domain -containing protein [Methanobacterium spitsbergense]|uniref:PAS domain S-box protein n=1 Tax=Methanobacterium spitsbergense TaxID=2874285 RepID=A0A8T5UXZ8_9EURY|nr:histidine kinase dimerization/phosphoacceptor domain -containing protein [Methanobacterium spitsbergense]MBZ2166806.1 PAS domain S-box protein [Methanobacterium spitsbergense]